MDIFKLLKNFDDEINKIRLARDDARDKYIKENSKFLIGERVKVFTPAYATRSIIDRSHIMAEPDKTQFGYIKEINLNRFKPDGLEYILFCEKKDGTQSKNTFYYSNTAILSKP